MKIASAERASRFVLIVGLMTLLATWSEQRIVLQASADSQLPDPIEYVVGIALGLRDFVVENTKCLINLILHPVATSKEMVRATIHYDETYAKVKKVVDNTLQQYPDLSACEKGRLHSRLVAEAFYLVGILVVPSLGIAKLDLGLATHKLMTPVTRLTSKNSSSIQQTIGFAEWFAYEDNFH